MASKKRHDFFTKRETDDEVFRLFEDTMFLLDYRDRKGRTLTSKPST